MFANWMSDPLQAMTVMENIDSSAHCCFSCIEFLQTHTSVQRKSVCLYIFDFSVGKYRTLLLYADFSIDVSYYVTLGQIIKFMQRVFTVIFSIKY